MTFRQIYMNTASPNLGQAVLIDILQGVAQVVQDEMLGRDCLDKVDQVDNHRVDLPFGVSSDACALYVCVCKMKPMGIKSWRFRNIDVCVCVCACVCAREWVCGETYDHRKES